MAVKGQAPVFAPCLRSGLGVSNQDRFAQFRASKFSDESSLFSGPPTSTSLDLLIFCRSFDFITDTPCKTVWYTRSRI
jgi:hypothetical protein